MIISDSIVQGATALAGGGAAGFFIGYALRKIIRILMVVLGAFLVALLYFQYQGYINVRWDRINAGIESALHTNQTQLAAGGTDMLNNVFNTLGIPLSSGLAAGALVGFLKG